jgi:hypothetical protein
MHPRPADRDAAAVAGACRPRHPNSLFEYLSRGMLIEENGLPRGRSTTGAKDTASLAATNARLSATARSQWLRPTRASSTFWLVEVYFTRSARSSRSSSGWFGRVILRSSTASRKAANTSRRHSR